MLTDELCALLEERERDRGEGLFFCFVHFTIYSYSVVILKIECVVFCQVVSGINYRLVVRLGELDCMRNEDKDPSACQVNRVSFTDINFVM